MSASPTPTVPPFPAFPATGRYVELGSTGDSLSRLFRAVDAREALSLVIGPPGVGKSLLCELVAEGHRDSHDVVVVNQAPIENKNSLIRHLLHGLGVKPDNETDLHLQLVDRVCGSVSKNGLLIVVDEAQTLAAEVLEAIRMVTNIVSRGQRRVMAILCGNPKMDDRLADPAMESLVQRVATRCYLHPLEEGHTRTYIRQTIANCGSDPDHTIDDAAAAAIHLATGGVPRLINQMMTEAIDCAARADRGMIDADLVNLAWSNLQQLPSPMVDDPTLSPILESLPVEFGSLDDDNDGGDDDGKPVAEVVAIPAAPTAEELFGDFSDEIAIEVGTAPRAPAMQTASLHQATSIEEDLHREVTAMSDETQRRCAPQQNMYTELAAFEPTPMHDDELVNETPGSDASGNDASSALTGEDFVGSAQDIEFGSLEPVENPTATFELSETLRDDVVALESQIEPASDASQSSFEPAAATDVGGQPVANVLRRDDLDILVVEDSIEMTLESEDDAAEPFSVESVGGQPVTDFQAMMSRMRAGA